jgi:hypothetical protein
MTRSRPRRAGAEAYVMILEDASNATYCNPTSVVSFCKHTPLQVLRHPAAFEGSRVYMCTTLVHHHIPQFFETANTPQLIPVMPHYTIGGSVFARPNRQNPARSNRL